MDFCMNWTQGIVPTLYHGAPTEINAIPTAYYPEYGGWGAFVKGSRSSVREVTSYNYSTNYRGDTPESDEQQRYTVLTFRMAGNHESDQVTRFITLGQALTNNQPLMLAMGEPKRS